VCRELRPRHRHNLRSSHRDEILVVLDVLAVPSRTSRQVVQRSQLGVQRLLRSTCPAAAAAVSCLHVMEQDHELMNLADTAAACVNETAGAQMPAYKYE
jgi:hypothetical protein